MAAGRVSKRAVIRLLRIGTVLTVLGLSLSANVYLGQQLSRAFANIQMLRIFPLGYRDVSVKMLKRASVTGGGAVRILLVGDSRASMWDPVGLPADYQLRSIAHGGMTSSQVLLQLATSSLPGSDWVICQVGINDLHPLGALPAEHERIPAQLDRNLDAIMTYLLADGQRRVILTTLFPRSAVPLKRKLLWDPATDKAVTRFNRRLRSLANHERVYLLDAFATLADSDGLLRREFVDDDFFLHVNAAAYAALNRELRKLIDSVNPRP